MTVSRRDFLQATAGSAAGLLISFYVPQGVRAAPKAAQPPPLSPNAFVRVGTDESVTVVLAHSEMGQGIWTGLAMLIAEELECDWSKVRSEHAPAAPVYGHPALQFQMTGGSSTTNGEFERYRTVGAMAKDMLLRAAAARWKVAPAACTAANGVVTHGKDKLTYGQLAEEAMKLAPPAKVKLKDPKDWKLIGTLVRRIDTPEKVTGKAQFGLDVHFPGLRTAVVLRPPAFGAKLVKFDAADALKVPGVEKVVPTANGVAVVAAHFWAAKLGRDALRAEWAQPEGGGVDSAKLLADFHAQARTPGVVAASVGKVEDALAAAKSRLEAEYDVPYLAHAPMEPLNCTVKIDGDRCEIWTGTQFQTGDQMAAAKILGTTPDKVQIHTTFLGGGFGRRASPAADFVGEAVIVAKAAGVPVKVVWTREDDMRGGFYRPAFVHRIQVGVDARGVPAAWDQVVVGQSIVAGTPLESFVTKNGVDLTSVEGIAESPYVERTPALRVSLHSPRTPVTVLWWRSVGNTHTAFAVESMVDELAHAAGQDPLAYRLELLKDKPRHANALKVAAEKAGWGTAPAPGRARGLAMHESFGSIIAEVAEVSIEKGRIRVHSVTCSVDCGTAVNPLGIEAQIQGSVAFGLTAALYGKINIAEGKVQESNFHDYPMLRMFDMPRIAVHLIPSKAKMGGIGEPATAPIAPAVANAVFALTKQRLRSLPFRLA
ncbi:xanthine dehydrogenase family protein molybdopterin-binding subunit [Sorangium atrum]|uniref:Xanthine dehydrogenase family protein molybdopterin-binding subunit n=1 Tax=Sorangium atrum TaxID=2995308 RepID=A0ABT5C511_9BACT|nr:xanthine dehydrogenase family protein molybdopterin-binding subunit [Sorangium aterium]MDC0681512.1 xanthine dehydrogenase family protein molybdopterin-binding subunit [Sorangium aterium]